MLIIFLAYCGNLYVIIELIEQIKLDAEGGFRWKCGVGGGGEGGLIPLFVAYSGGVLLFIHRFRRGLVRQNLCNYFLYLYHMQRSKLFHIFA